MLTRRRLITIGMTAPGWAGATRLLAFERGQFWNERPAAEWSEQEVQQLLARSPWAKEAEVQFKLPGGDGPMSGGGPGGGPGGGMGGPPGGPPGDIGGMPQMKATVRWETAVPVVEAQKHQPDPDAAHHYVVSVSGLPMFGGPPAGGRDEPSGSSERPRRPAPDPGHRNAMIGSLKQSSALQRKGKDQIAAGRVGELEGSETPTLLYYFPRAGDPITVADKEVTFVAQIGPLFLKVKFALRDMQYHGQISL